MRLVLGIITAVILAAEVFSSTGIMPAPHDMVVSRLLATTMGVFNFGTLAVHFVILRFFSRSTWAEGAQLFGISALFLLACKAMEFAADVPVWYLVTVPAAAFGFISLAGFVLGAIRATGAERRRNRILLAASAMVFGLFMTSDPLLHLTAALRPAAYDHAAYILDGTLGFQASILLARLFASHGWLDYLGTAGYFFIAYGFSALFGLQFARPDRVSANILKFIALCFPIVLVLYLICPVAGPEYAFGANFPDRMPAAGELSPVAAVIPPAARNGVPSMHAGWALGLFINALPFSWPIRALFATLLLLNLLSTLGLGEHYLVDLVIAFPFILAIQALCVGPRRIGQASYRAAVAFGCGMTAFWVLVLIAGVPWFSAVPGLTWAIIVVTLAGSAWFGRPLLGLPAQEASVSAVSEVPAPARAPLAWAAPEVAVAVLFFLSGFAALMYQVLFSKALSYTFGSAATATFTVLATYMGGMAMGAWLGGRIAAWRSDPLRVYAICEVGIAVYCLATPAIFAAMQSLYVALATGSRPDDVTLLVLRFLLGVLVLLPPTVLMGVTLPVLVRQLARAGELPGVPLAALYSANTAGAALGALLSGYLIIPALGMTNGVRMAAWINFLVAGAAYIIFNRFMPPQGVPESGAPAGARAEILQPARRHGRAALMILALGGVVSLGLEVAYVHVLAIVAGNSVYAFALMLFVFLLALGSGSEVARRLLQKNWPPALLVTLAQTGLAAAIIGGIFLWTKLPGYFALFQGYPLTATFGAREFVRGVVCFVGMFPAAFCIGMYYAPCLQLVAAGSTHRMQSLGTAIALNTAGNILGVLLVGFVLLPALGSLLTLQVLAAATLLLALILAHALTHRVRAAQRYAIAGLLLVIFLQPDRFDYERLATGANVYFTNLVWGNVIDHAESMDGGLTTVHSFPVPGAARELKILLTNGKFQGNDSSGGELIAQTAYGLVPLLHTRARGDALVIGYGTGTTARVLSDAGFERLDLVDISRDVFDLANRHFSAINRGVAYRQGVQSYVTDGRNFLLLGTKEYDVICVQLSSIWFAGAAALYNREFYALVRARLAPAGVLQQWFQLHHVQPLDVAYMLGSVRAEFRHVWLYVVGEQGVIVAGNDPERRPNAENTDRLDGTERLRVLLPPGAGSFAVLHEKVLLDPDDVDRLLNEFSGRRGAPVSTDDNVVLEYSTPRGNVLDYENSLLTNISILAQFQGTGGVPTPAVRGPEQARSQ